ncbi:MAG TPA: hypothetical protein VMJ93_12045 [Verrucomicrobiae bacterium]|nr:hypothetical protein [Verrucomicrobiae bacterium]
MRSAQQKWTHRLVVGVAVAALLAAIGSETAATTFARMSVAEMARRAGTVVRARCLANAIAWDGGEIWTFTTFAVQETWKGDSAGEIRIRLLGGRTNDITSTVPGVPRFRPGEDVILFLERTIRGDYSVVSWMQGTFRIRRMSPDGEESATQDTAAFEVYDPPTRTFIAAGVRGESLQKLKMEVQSAGAAAPSEGKLTR